MSNLFLRNTLLLKTNLFSRLTVPQQAEILFHEGYYVNTREEPGVFVDTYQLHNSFIEIYFHKKKADLVVVKTFYSMEDIETNTMEKDILFPTHFSWRSESYAC